MKLGRMRSVPTGIMLASRHRTETALCLFAISVGLAFPKHTVPQNLPATGGFAFCKDTIFRKLPARHKENTRKDSNPLEQQKRF